MSTPGNNSNISNPTIIGISHQPYRSYLTDRNHFYHSASVANPSGQLNSMPNSTGSNSVHYSQTPSSLQSSPAKSATTTATVGSNQLTNSRTSLNSNSSAHRNAMAKTKRSSTTSSTLPIGSDGYATKNPETDDEDEYMYGQPSACSRCLFGFLWVLAQIGLWGSVLLLAYWIFKFDKGFAFQNDKRKMFNLHSFLMLTGFIFVNGQCEYSYLCNLSLDILNANSFFSYAHFAHSS